MKKVFVFLPDGIGLRNFAFTAFKELGEQQGFDIIYWNNSVFPLGENFGHKEVKIENKSIYPLTPIYSRARKRLELDLWQKKFNDPVYETYKFPLNFKGIKSTFKSIYTQFLIKLYKGGAGIKKVREKIKFLERKNSKYNYCKAQLEEHKPDIVFCTSQRSTQAISALLAAKDIGIPTAAFIHSWDNIPKAMLVVEPDYYFVWSPIMKEELLKYYPYLNAEQVYVTGTPQFEPHYNAELIMPRDTFFEKYGLEKDRKYICFSGDDTTTSPLDQYYLEDLAKAVRDLNSEGENLGVIFRQCPVDNTNRYDKVLKEFSDIIVPIKPIWTEIGGEWNQVLPKEEDFGLLSTICEHTEFVANVCSSMVFDFAIHNKPCIYFNYEQPQLKKGIRDIGQNYKYVHFRSMPSKDAVAWAESKEQVKFAVKKLLKDPKPTVKEAKKWYKIVAGKDAEHASDRIWKNIKEITS